MASSHNTWPRFVFGVGSLLVAAVRLFSDFVAGPWRGLRGILPLDRLAHGFDRPRRRAHSYHLGSITVFALADPRGGESQH